MGWGYLYEEIVKEDTLVLGTFEMYVNVPLADDSIMISIIISFSSYFQVPDIPGQGVQAGGERHVDLPSGAAQPDDRSQQQDGPRVQVPGAPCQLL